VPYAKVVGGGDGTADWFQFHVSDQMVDTSAGTVVSQSTATGQFYTKAILKLDGKTAAGGAGVNAGDAWSLGLRYRTYEAQATGSDDAATSRSRRHSSMSRS